MNESQDTDTKYDKKETHEQQSKKVINHVLRNSSKVLKTRGDHKSDGANNLASRDSKKITQVDFRVDTSGDNSEEPDDESGSGASGDSGENETTGGWD